MQIVATSSTSPATAGPRARAGLDALQSEDFLKLLITELRQQDPLQPNTTGDMLARVSNVRMIELSQRLGATLSDLAAQQRSAGVSDLIGRYVTARLTGDDGRTYETSGIVTGVRFDRQGAAFLELDTGESVPALAVVHVTAPETAETARAAAARETAGDATARRSSGASAPPAAAASDGKAPARRRLLPWLSLDGMFHL